MNGPHREGFEQACQVEYETLTKMGVWDVVPRQPWMNVIQSTWAFRFKVWPDGTIKKLKARFCARGDTQVEGVDFFDTYAPVVSWTTVRLILILTVELGLATKQVDYTAAFVHADIDKPPGCDLMSEAEKSRSGVYVEMPRGFQQPGHVLKLRKSLYGLCQSPRNFFTHLKANLEKIGFKQCTDVDPCLFISDKVLCITYVDDCIFVGPEAKDIDEMLSLLKKSMVLEEEDDAAGFLGVKITRTDDEIKLTQEGLTKRIIEALKIDDLPAVDTPAEEVLGKDLDGDPAEGAFNYASVIGMMWYLYGHSRPDLGFAVSQCARFSFCPKRSHELALIRIGQYLKGTIDKGLILKPMSTDRFQMDVYVDVDFMGKYGSERRDDPDNVKSRTGYVILLNDCPIIWGSKLQESIALSTMMAEYYALSSTMREVLPLRDLVKRVAQGCGLNDDCTTDFKTRVHEDNNGVIALCDLDPGQHTARSKHFDSKVHWFRAHLKCQGSNSLTVNKVETREQLADMFTKPLSKDAFQYLRKKLMGW